MEAPRALASTGPSYGNCTMPLRLRNPETMAQR
jgi:hypothetical protein